MSNNHGTKFSTHAVTDTPASLASIATPFAFSAATSASEFSTGRRTVKFLTSWPPTLMCCLSAPFTTLPAVMVTFWMLSCSSSSRYCVYEICFDASALLPDSWIKTTGIRMMRIQKERFLENRPQLKSFLFVGGSGRGITASSLYTECAGNFPRDPTHTPRGTHWVH